MGALGGIIILGILILKIYEICNIVSQEITKQKINTLLNSNSSNAGNSNVRLQELEQSNVSKLYHSVMSNDVQAVRNLMHNGLNPNIESAGAGHVLLYAAMYGNIEIFKSLVENGANVNATKIDKGTPLMLCAFHGYTDCFNYLINQKADINALDNENWNVLMFASLGGSLDIVQTCISKGINPKAKNIEGDTALDIAKRNFNMAVVEYLYHL